MFIFFVLIIPFFANGQIQDGNKKDWWKECENKVLRIRYGQGDSIIWVGMTKHEVEKVLPCLKDAGRTVTQFGKFETLMSYDSKLIITLLNDKLESYTTVE
ncbi:MAG TPA: hypothetical protein DEP28_01850 [Bacteroidetes bacterium]|nr:hypothetical protein [Bacteroidota bacterium]